MDKSQEILFKRYILNITYIITSYFILGHFLFDAVPDSFMRNYHLVASFVHLSGIVVFHIVPVLYIKKIFNVYYIVLFVTLYFLTILELVETGRVEVFLWWMSLIVVLYTVHPDKKGVRLAGWCFILMLSVLVLVFVLRHMLYDDKPLNATSSTPMVYAVRGGMINAVCAMLTIWLSLRYIYMFYQMMHRQHYDPGKPASQADYFPDMDDEEYKYEKIYSKIEEYFKTEQPYLNAGFSLSKLSNDLNINHAYLSKAISQKKSMNFNSFINSYRIAKAKELIRESPQYTLEHIYLTSGFKNHVSFNNAFKAVEKVTPSEYRRLLEISLPNNCIRYET